ncbi:phosphoglucomutase/phosphomannomutase alpha/beta/alpha domain I [Oleidesulfovibrio alaskensis G20]|jgi:phosphomannomutase/phosphoglucomutase|uniref:Phosphoglucomutase/phosphomannomutase alpha/beta/alpha domain I n=1 Tax=Oleidesulfovibrio alaskensis (strain ATCC BAA-1058 / DSM 17464 / G20) TaxID=207559 RepID=Q30X57_OLEA2|nr:phosphomannomutase/phosphoglucomutase [Oleidesulfovibrio alaskensis]ABB39739.1 phosphoglucomutase/phosphomannomutase alpha/beta/alpha domain I [Oleidesulfovibrio alaskensis G20]MBG0774695.1 phosphomannomutase/phosphoglucomutase [Oleidesulfovibrio alaskensis]MBL3582040.1 phosphomannomutase/phosphoglucomutase [Oleidesulfovibrio alaskensis]
MKPVNKAVFRAYDIRGLVDVDFDEEWVELLGRAVGTYMLRRGIGAAVTGHDCRHSSPGYHAALTRGMLSTGLDVTSVGMVPTPVLYFAVRHLNRQGGVVITASHNPPEYNGFKVWAGRTTIHTDQITAIYDILAARDFESGSGAGCDVDIIPDYIEAASRDITLRRPVRVVLDGGNGAGGLVCAELLRRIGADVVEQYCEPDGSFPNHHPDPVVEKNMGDLQARVRAEKACCGIGLDGDADRLGVVDENGRLLFGDQLLAMYARDTLRRFPGALVMGDVKCSHLLFRDIEQHGGRPLMWITGHSVMKAKMLEADAKLAGEMSGHMFFNDRWYGFDDAIYGAARFLEILAASDQPVSAMPGWPETASTPELHMECPDAVKFDIVRRAQEFFGSRYTVDTIDGVRLLFEDGWGLVRASNTQPVLVLRFEAQTAERLAQIRAIVENPLRDWVAQAVKAQA